MEEWKEVIGFEQRYLVSNTGKIYSILANRILKTCISNRGYELVCLRNEEGKRKQYTVHKIVATAFIPNPNGYPIINHKDENKLNNSISNLEWCSYSYNNTYNHIREKATNTLINNNQIFYIYDLDMNLIGEFKNMRKFCREYNVNNGNLRKILNKNKVKPFHYSIHGFIPSYNKFCVDTPSE